MAKIFHFHAGTFMPPTGSLPSCAGLFELVCGFLFLVSFQTRIAAFLLSSLRLRPISSAICRKASSRLKTAEWQRPFAAAYPPG
jgi:hypothetical protein